MTKLILWDIDGTLLYSGGVAGEAMRAAMLQVYGRSSDNERISYAGKTDQQIIFETFAEREQAELRGMVPRFMETYVAELARRRAELRERARVLPGIRAMLDALVQRDTVQSVLTGNVKPAAHLKLELMDLLGYFDMEVGAFGSDHHHRPELVPIAIKRAERRYGKQFASADVVVIGDTPHDIGCGKAGGARTVGVATGPFSVDDLRACEADAVLPDMADTDTALRAVLGM
jgi:phosphoglycolate phosphatase-like HAD superfamily hydrolase